MSTDIIVSGMRPTGKLHLGNYHGALKNFVTLQDKYKCFFFVADLHALTTAYEKCTIFIQSDVPEVSELNTLLGMITPLGWLYRNPTYKDQINELLARKYAGQLKGDENTPLAERVKGLADEDISVYGFLGYPVLMAVDILIHKAGLVPVGKDQTAHLEIARDLVRRFNEIYKTEDVFVEPKPLYTEVAVVPGLDGHKMSKSYNNTIDLGEDLDSVRKKVMSMFTDPNKKKATDPADPEGCVVFAFHKIYNPNWKKRCEECKAGALGCVACKKELFALMEPEMKGFLERRKVFESDKAQLQAILHGGKEAARASAAVTLQQAKRAMKVIK